MTRRLIAYTIVSILAVPPAAPAAIRWIAGSKKCEPPSKFYATLTKPKNDPCTPLIPGVCPYGVTCGGDFKCASPFQDISCRQTCPSGYSPNAAGRCVTTNACPCGAGERCLGNVCVLDIAVPVERPNVILFVGDDHGACGYGHSRECRTPNSGAAILAAYTPNLDTLAAYGTVFPLAQTGAAICAPARATLFSGRLHRHLGPSKLLSSVANLANSVRQLGGAGGVPDPYDCDRQGTTCVHHTGQVVPADWVNDSSKTKIQASVVGGYATFLAGKGAPTSHTAAGFHATGEGSGVARTPDCTFPSNQPPQCGTGTAPLPLPPSSTCDAAPYSSGCRTSTAPPFASPVAISHNMTLFEFIDALVYPAPGGGYKVQNFFAWYAPKMPHEPVNPDTRIVDYLFGASLQGGIFPNLSGLSSHYTGETEGGDPVTDYYGMTWWVDDAVREIRKYLAADRCITRAPSNGPVGVDWTKTTSSACTGSGTSWTDLNLDENTVIIYMADHGRFLIDAKHNFSNNGYNSNLIVYDPRAITTRPKWWAQNEPGWKSGHTPPMATRLELAHAIDVLPTVVGLALNTTAEQTCPVSGGISDSGHDQAQPKECFGKDLRPHFGRTATSPPLPAAATDPLRKALCGHHTRTGGQENEYYALARAGVCKTSGGALITDADLGGKPRPCLTADECPGTSPQCDRTSLWCANDPTGTACTSDSECADRPACSSDTGVACSALCKPRLLKFYVGPGTTLRTAMTDLFLDPDEGLPEDHKDLLESAGNNGSIARRLSGIGSSDADYAEIRSKLQGCVRDWAPPNVVPSSAHSCPTDFVCDGLS